MAKLIQHYFRPTLGGDPGPRLGPYGGPVVFDGWVIQAGGLTIAQPREELDGEGNPLPPEEGFRFQVGDPEKIDFEGLPPDEGWAFTLYDGFESEAVVVEVEE